MPAIIPVLVTVMSSLAREMPKSVILTVPLSPSSTLPGLMSRCTMPAACAAASAAATCEPIQATSPCGISPRSTITSARLREGRYSITRQGAPSSSTTSNTVMALGWWSLAAIRPSRIARSMASLRSAAVRPGWSSNCLTATTRASRSSWACHTTPMAPLPMRSVSRYRPATRKPS